MSSWILRFISFWKLQIQVAKMANDTISDSTAPGFLEATEEHVSFLFNLTELSKDPWKQSIPTDLNRWNKAAQVSK